MRELGFIIPTPIEVFTDSDSAKGLSYNPIHHDRTKHIDIRFHRIREFIIDGTIVVKHTCIATEDNPADMFTCCKVCY